MTSPSRESAEISAEAQAELRRRISGEVHFDGFTRALYSTDASIYQIQPLGVVMPRSVEDVIATVTIAAQHRIPVLPRGGGSSQAGQTVGTALVIDFSRHLDKVIEINSEARTARVQPGIPLANLNLRLAATGLRFGPDPSSANRACLGGMVGNNGSGTHSMLYGLTVEHVRALECVLADGTTARFGPLDSHTRAAKEKAGGLEGAIYRGLGDILHRHAVEISTGYPKTWQRVGGYNLNRLLNTETFNLAGLITGSEGTLATITEIELGLVSQPPRTALLVIHFDRLIDSLAATPAILETAPSAVELMDGFLLRLTRGVPAYARQLTFVEGEPEALLVVEYYGSDERELKGRLDALETLLRRERIGGVTVRATAQADIDRVWGVRKAGLGLLMSVKGDFKPIPFVEDAAVPVEHLADYIDNLQRLADEHDTQVAYYAHASVGLLHVRPLINLKEAVGIERMAAIAEGSFQLVVGYGGAISGEHGDGLSRSGFNERLFGPALYQAFRETKYLFDPAGIMNPGKIVDAPPMTENLRYGPAYRTVKLNTVYDFAADYGFAGAVEMCNGSAVCRRLQGGTMCPSYQATRDEEHSTRGRANLLRAALSGVLPTESLTSERMYAALDLCLECKACKAECPSSVDMAKLKAEWLGHYYAEHGVPLRARLFAHIHTLSRLGSATAPLSNWMGGHRATRLLLEKTVGIHRDRTLPRFARTPFDRWFKQRERPVGSGRSQVVLFHDTFMTYNEPEIGIAATEVLEASGYEVVLLEKRRCCGRPMISKGLLKEAKANAAHNVALLLPYAERGIPIIGCEPSCLLTIRDDYPDLVDRPAAQLVADHALLFEEFLTTRVPKEQMRFGDRRQHVLVHGHCHQKTLVGMGSTKAALSLPPNFEVEEIASGCCGMAGSFGYEGEHYELSMQIGGMKLLPAVSAAAPETEIVASGTSCRQQIAHGTGRKARHPAVVLREALLDPAAHRREKPSGKTLPAWFPEP